LRRRRWERRPEGQAQTASSVDGWGGWGDDPTAPGITPLGSRDWRAASYGVGSPWRFAPYVTVFSVDLFLLQHDPCYHALVYICIRFPLFVYRRNKSCCVTRFTSFNDLILRCRSGWSNSRSYYTQIERVLLEEWLVLDCVNSHPQTTCNTPFIPTP
jgi:hypothetical protein